MEVAKSNRKERGISYESGERSTFDVPFEWYYSRDCDGSCLSVGMEEAEEMVGGRRGCGGVDGGGGSTATKIARAKKFQVFQPRGKPCLYSRTQQSGCHLAA